MSGTGIEHGESRAGWEDLARAAAVFDAADAGAEEIRQLLRFQVDGSPYALGVERVREIVRVRPITPIPRVACEVRGVISLRGEIIQVVDLRTRLGLRSATSDRDTRIVVVQTEDGRAVGLLVDEVREVMRVPETELRPPSGGEGGGIVQALCASGEEFVSLIDLERALELDHA